MDEQRTSKLNSRGEPVMDTVLEVKDVITDGDMFVQGLFDRIHAEAGLGPTPDGPVKVMKEN